MNKTESRKSTLGVDNGGNAFHNFVDRCLGRNGPNDRRPERRSNETIVSRHEQNRVASRALKVVSVNVKKPLNSW